MQYDFCCSPPAKRAKRVPLCSLLFLYEHIYNSSKNLSRVRFGKSSLSVGVHTTPIIHLCPLFMDAHSSTVTETDKLCGL